MGGEDIFLSARVHMKIYHELIAWISWYQNEVESVIIKSEKFGLDSLSLQVRKYTISAACQSY